MIYLFNCQKCDKTEEREIPITEYDQKKNEQICNCGAKMERVFTPIAGTEYKCKGFYDTDVREVGGR